MSTFLLRFLISSSKEVIIALIIQVSFLGALGLEQIGIDIPILREVLGFIYITIVPGMLFLRALDRSKNFTVEKFLYSIGLSIILLVFIGLFVNLVYPLWGIQKPLSTIPMIVTLVSVVTILIIFVILKRRGVSYSFNISHIMVKYSLLLSLLLLVTVIGTCLTHCYNSNVLLIVSLLIVSLIPILVILGKIPNEVLPLVIFVVSATLMYHNFLSTPYLLGQDIQVEYYFANVVYLNSLWNPSFEYQANSLLNTVILPSMYSKMLSLPLIWTIKTVYPLLFSIGVVALYQAFKNQIGEKMAFLSAFFFASQYVNYHVMYMKHYVLIFFSCLFVLSLFDKDLNLNIILKRFLSICFIIGLVFSHYGLPYLLIGASIFTLILLRCFKIEGTKLNFLTTPHFVILSIIMMTSWHSYTSSSAGFKAVIEVGGRIINSIFELFKPMEGSGLHLLHYQSLSWEWEVLKVMYIITQTLVVVGFLVILSQKLSCKGSNKGTDIPDEYFYYSTAFLVLMAINLFMPIFQAQTIALGRIYNFSLVFLAPYCIIGGVAIIKKLFRFEKQHALKILSVFFTIFLLLNTQVIMEINRNLLSDGYARSPSLSYPRIMKGQASLEEIAGFFGSYVSPSDVYGAKWLGRYMDKGRKIATDFSPAVCYYGMIPRYNHIYCSSLESMRNCIENENIYILLKGHNLKFDLMLGNPVVGQNWKTSEIIQILNLKKNKVYSNVRTTIYE